MDISVIVPVWNEEDIIERFCFDLFDVLKHSRQESEVIFVDDGSTDNTFKILKGIFIDSKRVKIIKLTRNFGQHLALLTGMYYVKGKIIITLDADLDYSLRGIYEFVKEINKGYDCVFGWRKGYGAGFLNFVFYSCLKFLTHSKVHDFTCPLRALRRKVVEDMKKCGSIDKISSSLADRCCSEVVIEIYRDKMKKSSYNFFRKCRLAFRMIFDIIFKNMSKGKHIFKPDLIIKKVLSYDVEDNFIRR